MIHDELVWCCCGWSSRGERRNFFKEVVNLDILLHDVISFLLRRRVEMRNQSYLQGCSTGTTLRSDAYAWQFLLAHGKFYLIISKLLIINRIVNENKIEIELTSKYFAVKTR